MPHRAKPRALAWFRRGICYLLNDSFDVAEAAPLATPRMCRPGPGQLILDQTDGQFSIVGGEFIWPVQATPAWGDQEWHALKNDGDEYDTSGIKLLLKFRGAWLTSGLALSSWFGFNLNPTPDTVANAEHTFYRAVALGSGIRCTSGASDNALALRDLWSANLGDYFQAAILLRPYTVGGLHWYPGATGTFAYGAHFFWRDEAGANSWRLAWYRQLQSRTDPLYPAFSNYDSAGKFDYARIPCDNQAIWNPLFTPIAWDEFTDANGVLLPNHTITYGPGLAWVNDAGAWIITGNKADPPGGTTYATIHTLTPDVWVESAVDAMLTWIGLTLRKSADTSGGNNHWHFELKAGVAGTDTYMTEVNNGITSYRATADLDWVAAPRNLRVRAVGLQITLYVDYVEALHYASAWFNIRATWHGLHAQAYDEARFDNLIILPRGTGLARICYDSFTAADGTSLDAHAPDEGGQVWVEDGGNWDIQTNEAREANALANSTAHVNTQASDCWVDARMLMTNLEEGLSLRKSADTVGGRNEWIYTIMAGIAGNDTFLREYNDGVLTIRAQADVDPVAGTRYYLAAECLGPIITCYMDGTQHLQYNTATFNQTASRHGLHERGGDNTARWDQFRVTQIPALGEYDRALNSF